MSYTKVVHGSCHCGTIQYFLRLTFPPILKTNYSRDPSASDTIRIYRCNCTTCHKMGYFHCRPISSAEDFIMTAPATIEELGDYRVSDKKIAWHFCKTCGVRTFALGGEWEQAELDVDKWSGRKKEGDKDELQKVWRTKGVEILRDMGNGKKEVMPMHYLSANAVTLDGEEEGVDLVEWHDKGWVQYGENRFRDVTAGPPTWTSKPFECGMY